LDENFQSFNIDEARTNGVEFFLSTNTSKDLNLKATYTYTNAINTSENSPDFDKPLLRRPKIKIAFLVNYSINSKTNINLEIIHVGSREDKNFSSFPANRTILGSYDLVNLSAHYNLFESLQLYVRTENLFDVQYEEVYGYGIPGLSIYSGFKLNIF
jgi:vitamin B12 transporter